MSSDSGEANILKKVPQEEEEVCPITKTPISEIPPSEILWLPCFHKFQKEAIEYYLKSGGSTCPVCRHPVDAGMFGITVERQPVDSSEEDSEQEDTEGIINEPSLGFNDPEQIERDDKLIDENIESMNFMTILKNGEEDQLDSTPSTSELAGPVHITDSSTEETQQIGHSSIDQEEQEAERTAEDLGDDDSETDDDENQSEASLKDFIVHDESTEEDVEYVPSDDD